MTTENYYPVPSTKTQKAIICLPEEVQAWKDENQELKTQIDNQTVRIAELETDLAQEVYNSEAFMNEISKLVRYIVDLETQVKALKKIAISERSGCIRTESYDHADGMYMIDLPDAIERAKLELIEEHPEAFR